jgi:hypothetical protein
MTVSGSRGPLLRVVPEAVSGGRGYRRSDVLRVSWHQLRLIGGRAQRLLSERPTRIRRTS